VTPGSELSCTQGTWGPDLPGAQLYRAPASLTTQWSREGTEIPGATSSELIAETAASYTCAVTATNNAGSTTQTSEAHVVSAPPPNDISFGKLKRNRRLGTATLTVNVPGPGQISLRGRGLAPVRAAGKSPLRAVTAAGRVSLPVRARGKAKTRLNKRGSVVVAVKVTFVPTGGETNTESKRVKLIRKL
jgi:hypothetical protein